MEKDRKMEILAPVGGEDMLTAAVRSGADAVYLGISDFNARRNADNFGMDSLKSAVSFCHARGVKLYLTFNTLLKESEIKSAARAIEQIGEAGVDAMILQDFAAVSLVKEILPDMPLHASTQMTIHNVSGVRALEELGFSRAILARELSIQEIREIRNQTTIELEVFVHGALCMSVSGGCYLSAMLGGRSGNRGLCAQPCRLDFLLGERNYALSLKDMTAIDYVRELREAGVCSLKIEGRMKRPEYVAATVHAFSEVLEGRQAEKEMLRSVFSRGGFTDGYLTGKRTLQMFGRRSEEDKEKSKQVLGSIRSIYRNERQSVPITIQIDETEEMSAAFIMTDGKHIIQKPISLEEGECKKELIVKNLSKTGGTPFVLKESRITIGNERTIPSSVLSAIKKEAMAELLEARGKVEKQRIFKKEFSERPIHRVSDQPKVRVRSTHAFQVQNITADEVVLPVSEVLKKPELIQQYGERLLIEMPALVFGNREKVLEKDLAILKEAGASHVIAGNLGTFFLAKKLGFSVHGGDNLNIMNTESICAYKKMGAKDITLSFELSIKGVKQLGDDIARGILVYGKLPLMRMRACPNRDNNGCKKNCTGRFSLVDRKGVVFPLQCENREYTVLFNSVPLYYEEDLSGIVDFVTLYFTDETPEEIKKIMKLYQRREKPNFERTKGLYERTLL